MTAAAAPFGITTTKAFWVDKDSMAIKTETLKQLKLEGIEEPENLADFDKETLDQVAKNLRTPPRPQNASDPTPQPFVFSAKTQKRMLAAPEVVRYHITIDRVLTVGSMSYNTIMNFSDQWRALRDRKKEDAPAVPKITMDLPVIVWVEAFEVYLQRRIGARTIPLSYVTREIVDPVTPAPVVLWDLPHSEEHGSIEEELVARASHSHPLFREDNGEVFYLLEEATRSTQYIASIKPCERKKDGRTAFLSLKHQFA
jgi:hypothetical protein